MTERIHIPPMAQAAMVYETEPCGRTFHQDLLLHLECGYVIATPEAFMMTRPVRSDGEYHDITNPEHSFDAPDAWWIYAAAGDPMAMWKHEPYPLPLIGFERGNEPRFYPRDKLRHLCTIMATRSLQQADLLA